MLDLNSFTIRKAHNQTLFTRLHVMNYTNSKEIKNLFYLVEKNTQKLVDMKIKLKIFIRKTVFCTDQSEKICA